MKELLPKDISSLDALIEGASRICLTTHTRPDGDAVGSTFGMYAYLTELRGKHVSVVLNDRWPDSIAFAVPGEAASATFIREEDAAAAEGELGRCDLLICLDFNTLSRVAGLEGALAACPAPRVLIDHHPFPEADKFDMVFSDTQVSSASELTLHVLTALPGTGGEACNLPSQTLYDLMTGITTDTNNFANSVFPTTLEACSALIAAGVDRDDILDKLFKRSSEARVRAFGRLLADHMFITEEGVACIIVDDALFRSLGLVRGDTEGLVNIPLEIGRVRMSIFVHEEASEYRVSVRSKQDVLANAFVSRYFAGGGHDRAAGGRLPVGGRFKTSEDVEKYVRQCVKEYLK